MNALLQSLVRPAFGLLLVSGVATGAVVTSARPAEAGVVVSIGFGSGYAPAYRPYPPRYAYFRRRHYVPAVWAAPVFYPSYRRPYYYSSYGYGYGHGYYGRGYGYGYGYRYGYDRFRTAGGRRR